MEYFKSINPYNQAVLQQYPEHSETEVEEKVAAAQAYWQQHKQKKPIDGKVLERLAENLEDSSAAATLISREMGKPLSESWAEIEKCAWLCRYYAEQGPAFLAPEPIESSADYSERRYEALGVVLGIMPWNFPFWQVFRFAVPALMAGNAVLLKHAPNVQGCAFFIEKLMRQCGFAAGAFQVLTVAEHRLGGLIEDVRVKAVSFTGSTGAGRAVAAQCGKALKKCVLELGGSNAFLLFPDADPRAAAALAVKSRCQNAGQSCIAAKRFVVPQALLPDFCTALTEEMEALKMGDPLDEESQIGPLARADLAELAEKQVREAIKGGAILQCGGERRGNFFQPTVLRGVLPSMRVFREETFAPIAAVVGYQQLEDAVELCNQSEYGLGVSLITEDQALAEKYFAQFEEGAVFINQMVISDPRLPFGGVKASGYGRELSREGIREFTNIKTLYRKNRLS